MRSRICCSCWCLPLLILFHSFWSIQSQQVYNDDGYGDGYADGGYGDGYGADDYNNNEYAQDYGDGYSQQQQQDNLYADYAARQEMKEMGNTGGIGMGKFLLGSSLSYMFGAKFHSGRAVKKIKLKHQKEQKALYAQYYNDVYKLSEQNQELQLALEKLYDTLKNTEEAHELEAVQRDYDEFKQPDLDGDDRISRGEFNMYVKTYLANYPGMDESDYPTFEDFDHDGDGYVSFKEYAKQMAIQTQEAERKQAAGEDAASKKKKAAQQALKNLYK